MPSVSIVIPCYNGATFLAAALTSLFNQTRRPDEIIVVDDGSTDDSAQVAEAAGPPVRVIRQKNSGESVARNVGLRAATSDYVLFLDADDMLAPEALERLVAAATPLPGAVAVMGVLLFEKDPAEPFERTLPPSNGFFPTILGTNMPPHCWLVPRTAAIAVGGFREDLINSEDWDFIGRIAIKGTALVSIPYVGALYRRHPASQVATTPKPAILKGRLTVAETLAQGLLERQPLLEQYGDAAFWSLWAQILQARRNGVSNDDLQRAEHLTRQIARRKPHGLRGSSLRLAVSLLGVRTSEWLWSLRSAQQA